MFNPRRDLALELDTLRRKCASAVLTPQMIDEHAFTLTLLLGSGDADQAFDRLQSLEVAEGHEHFLDAALVALGFGPYRGNQADRWFAFLNEQHPGATNLRTARRWCDTGFELIIQAITAPRSEPFVHVTISSGGDGRTVEFSVQASWELPPEDAKDAAFVFSWWSGEEERGSRTLTLNGTRYEFTTGELPLDAQFSIQWPAFVNPQRWHVIEGSSLRVQVADWATDIIDYKVQASS